MTKSERTYLIGTAARIETTIDRLYKAMEQTDNSHVTNIIRKQIIALHGIIGRILEGGDSV